MKIFLSGKKFFLSLIVISLILTFAVPVLAVSTQIHIVKYANDGTTILSEKTLTYHEMEESLPVKGDGSTHYYLQGPVFINDPNPAAQEMLRWNPAEDTNVQEKDMGAVKGTDVKDLCNLVGGMSIGDVLNVKAADGLTREFAYKNIYSPPSRQGPVVITWYKDGKYPDTGYDEGMRLIFFADDSVNPWGIHAMGNYDWHESADRQYWYYYYQGNDDKFPTTTGLSMKYVSEILIYSNQPPNSGTGSSWGSGSGVKSIPAGAAPPDDTSQYGDKGSKLTTYSTGTLNGTVRLLYDSNSTPVVMNNRIREYSIPFTQPSGSNLTLARLYVYVSGSHGIQTNRGVIPSLQTWFNHHQLTEQKIYIDTDGDEHRNVSATYAYDVLPYMKGNSSNAVSLKNPDYDQTVFTADGVMLLVVYQDDEGPLTQYWIGEGCDVVLSDPRKGIFPDDATTVMEFGGTANISGMSDAALILISSGIDSLNTTEHEVKFNKETWYNAFDNRSVVQNLRIAVTSYMNGSGNSVSVQSTIRKMNGDYLVNRNAILVVEQNRSAGKISLTDPIPALPDVPDLQSLPSTLITNLTPGTSTFRVALHSNPEGALVFVDGLYLGKTTPYILEADSGKVHTIRFELEGFLPAERNLTVDNDTILCTDLYSEVYSTKGRSDELIEEREMTHSGGLYINSRPGPAVISLDGIQMPRKTPAIFNGLKEGSHTVRLSLEPPDPNIREGSGITYEDQEVYVYPYSIVPVDVAANTSRSEELIVDSGSLRGEQFTVNGQVVRKTLPSRIMAPFDSFITVFHNLSYVSYPVPVNEDHYLLIEPRRHYDLSLFVDSDPRGAEVFIDGFRTGLSTPYNFTNISDGRHRIMVTKYGFIPEERGITLLYTPVPISQTDLHFFLEEFPSGFLRVAGDTPGAAIILDGKDTGEVTPFIFSSVPTGLHSISVSNITITRKFPDVTVNALIPANISANFHEIPQD